MRTALLALVVGGTGCRFGFDDQPLAARDAAPDTVDATVCVAGPEQLGDGSCDDGRDNDCDGRIDHADDDCPVMRYRSVGASGSVLAGGQVEIAGEFAFLTTTLPDDVGVGDVLVLGAAQDAIAFVGERISATKLRVQAADGGLPPQRAAGTPFQLVRAYRTIGEWAQQSENPLIAAGVRDFDVGRDLVGADAALSVALYADAVETGSVVVATWTSSPDHYVRVFTPTRPNEVGRSQRHTGVYGSGQRFEATANVTALTFLTSHLRLEGLSVRSYPNAVGTIAGLEVIATAPDIDVRVSYCLADGNNTTDSNGIIHLEAVGATASGTFRVSNNIAYNAPNGSSECIWHRDTNGATAMFYIFHNTVWSCARGIEARDTAGRAIAINNVAFAASNALYEYNGPGEYGPGSMNNVTNDGTAGVVGPGGVTGAVAGQLFVDLGATVDLRLRADAPILGLGADLLEHPLLPVGDDIEGQPRPRTPDPGADQR